MLLNIIKRLISHLPSDWQSRLKQIQCRRQIRKGTFRSPEPEFAILEEFIEDGNWVIDVGANVGFYSKRFSELVGPKGRVICFEPVPETFAILVENLKYAKCSNVTLINAAVSDNPQSVSMVTPFSETTGLKNLQLSHLIINAESSGFDVLAFNLDSLMLPHRVDLVKIDAEGHEFSVLSGMIKLLKRDHPTLFVETGTKEVISLLTSIGYSVRALPGSPNKIFEATKF